MAEQVSRRDFLKTGATVAAMTAAGCSALPWSERPMHVGLQLYAVRDECANDFPGTVKKVGEMGFAGVEFAGYYGWEAKDLRKLLDDCGLKCCGTHIGIDALLGDELERTVEFHRILDNRFLIVPGLAEQYRSSADAWLDTALLFNNIAERLQPHGMLCGYHNHTVEFQPIDGQIPWDIFFENTVKEVVMQFDVGNGMHGGADPQKVLKKFPGRAKTMHAKPFHSGDPAAVIGRDEAPWPEIVALCRKVAGTEWMIVEQEKFKGTSLEGVAGCLNGLRALGL